MEKEYKRKVFSLLAEKFETDKIRDYFLDMCEEIPDYIFTMPSSTSGKYHNPKQCERFGQLYHIFMFHAVLEHLLRLEHNKEIFSNAMQRDLMRCVPAFHDAIKCGWNGSLHTVHEHPMLSAEWVRNTKVKNDIPSEYKEMIAGMCEAHSGEWTTNIRSNVVLPEPRNDMELFIHECDILSSRSDLDMIIPSGLKDVLFGVKSTEGETIEERIIW